MSSQSEKLRLLLLNLSDASSVQLIRQSTSCYHGGRRMLIRDYTPKGRKDSSTNGYAFKKVTSLSAFFWRRFGTPLTDAHSGLEHEIRRAIESWQRKGTPQVMLYFKSAIDEPFSSEGQEQY